MTGLAFHERTRIPYWKGAKKLTGRVITLRFLEDCDVCYGNRYLFFRFFGTSLLLTEEVAVKYYRAFDPEMVAEYLLGELESGEAYADYIEATKDIKEPRQAAVIFAKLWIKLGPELDLNAKPRNLFEPGTYDDQFEKLFEKKKFAVEHPDEDEPASEEKYDDE